MTKVIIDPTTHEIIQIIKDLDGFDIGSNIALDRQIPAQYPELYSWDTATDQFIIDPEKNILNLDTNLILGQGVHGIQPSFNNSKKISLALNSTAFSTIAAAANRLDLMPFIPAFDIKIKRFDLEVTTLIAASQARLGWYNSDSLGNPYQLLSNSGLLDCSTVGFKQWGPSQPHKFKKGGIYWLAVHSSAGQIYRGVPLAGLLPVEPPASGTAVPTLKRATSTFASGLPPVAPASTAMAAIVPYVSMLLA